MLLGKPIRAHVIAVRPGHALNSELSKKILQVHKEKKSGKKPGDGCWSRPLCTEDAQGCSCTGTVEPPPELLPSDLEEPRGAEGVGP